MSSREEFNEWFANQSWGECYADVKDHLFSAWKASREALVIELPTQSEGNRPYNQGVFDTKVAIESAGVQVKS